MRHISFTQKSILLFVFILGGLVVCSLLGYVIAMYGMGLSFQELGNPTSYAAIQGLKIAQVFSALGTYLLPAILLALMLKEKPLSFLKLDQLPAATPMLLVLVIVFVLFPFNGFIAEWNSRMPLPEMLLDYERQIDHTIQLFMQMESPIDLWSNLFVIALIAGLSEEVLFRGVIQRLLMERLKQPHLAIWITAILFSAIHFQFSGFFPRMFLGALFGYLFFWGRSLWYPIIGHVLHNGTTVILAYWMGMDELEQIGGSNDVMSIVLALFSLLVALSIVYGFKYWFSRNVTR